MDENSTEIGGKTYTFDELVSFPRETRAQHLAWCKQRALEYVDRGDLHNAFASMASDLNKHPGTEHHGGLQLGLMLLMSGHLDTAEKMREHIEGYN